MSALMRSLCFVATCVIAGAVHAQQPSWTPPAPSERCPSEISPNPDKLISLPVHQLALVIHGGHLLENLKLDELAAKKVYEFAFVMQPLKMQGGTGSTVAPVAVR